MVFDVAQQQLIYKGINYKKLLVSRFCSWMFQPKKLADVVSFTLVAGHPMWAATNNRLEILLVPSLGCYGSSSSN